MGLKERLKILGKNVVSVGAAATMGFSTTAANPKTDEKMYETQQTEQVKKDLAPSRSVEELERAVQEREWINGEPHSKRMERFRKIRKEKGIKAAWDCMDQEGMKDIEFREKREDGSYAFWRLRSKDKPTSEVWHPNGVLASRFWWPTGKAIGYYPDGSKSFEQNSFDDPRSEYYPNGQLKMSPHRTREDAYDIFEENGRKVLHRDAIKDDKVLNIDLFDEKGQNVVASYTLDNYFFSPYNKSEGGTLTKVSVLNDKGKMETYNFKKPQVFISEWDSHFEFDLEVLKQFVKEDQQSQQLNKALLEQKLQDR